MNIKATLFAGVVLCIAREAAGNIKATLFVEVVLCIARVQEHALQSTVEMAFLT